MAQHDDDDEGHAIDDEAMASRENAAGDDIHEQIRAMMTSTVAKLQDVEKQRDEYEQRSFARRLQLQKLEHLYGMTRLHWIATYVFLTFALGAVALLALRHV